MAEDYMDNELAILSPKLRQRREDMIAMAKAHGIDDWQKLVQVRNFGHDRFYDLSKDSLSYHLWSLHKFAIDVVDGVPVFPLTRK